MHVGGARLLTGVGSHSSLITVNHVRFEHFLQWLGSNGSTYWLCSAFSQQVSRPEILNLCALFCFEIFKSHPKYGRFDDRVTLEYFEVDQASRDSGRVIYAQVLILLIRYHLIQHFFLVLYDEFYVFIFGENKYTLFSL